MRSQTANSVDGITRDGGSLTEHQMSVNRMSVAGAYMLGPHDFRTILNWAYWDFAERE